MKRCLLKIDSVILACLVTDAGSKDEEGAAHGREGWGGRRPTSLSV